MDTGPAAVARGGSCRRASLASGPSRPPWPSPAPAARPSPALWSWPCCSPSPPSQVTIAEEAAQLAPPDLARQIKKRKAAYEAGVLSPFDDADPERHRKFA